MMNSCSGGVADCGHPLPGGWPCHGASNFPIDPADSARDHPAIWQARHCAAVILIQATPEAMSTAEARVGNSEVLAEIASGTGQHVVLQTRGIRHRLLVSRTSCPVSSGFVVADDAILLARLAALSGFIAFSRPPGPATPSRHLGPTRYQRHRLELMLKALDLLDRHPRERPSLREMAWQLLRDNACHDRAIEWKTSAARRRIQRVVTEARQLASGGYFALLAGRMPKPLAAREV